MEENKARLCGCNRKSNEHCLHLAVNSSVSYLVSNYPEESNLIFGLLNKDCIKVSVSEYFFN